MDVKALLPLRAILVTGKGGVGKTTVAATVARFFAAEGKRVLATEIASDDDPSSALAAALGATTITEEPKEVAENLFLASLSPATGHQRFLRDVLPLKVMADAAMKTGAIRRFLSAAPTFPEMGILYRLLDLVRAKRKDGSWLHETIVCDLPATGHALALAQIPEALLKVISSGPIAAAVKEGLDFLVDPTQVGGLIVTLPETLPVSEAIELARAVTAHRIPVARIVVNRVPFNPFDAEERAFVDRTLVANPATLGIRTLERIDRARASLERLRTAVDIPVETMQDVWLDGPRLVEEMASLLSVDPASVVHAR